MARLGVLSSAASTCTDPVTGDMVICPPGTACDPLGSGQCIGTIASGSTVCPVGENLTTTGATCQCPSGYEYDANENMCVVGDVGVYASSPGMVDSASALAAIAPTTVTVDTTGLLYLALAGLAVWVFMSMGGKQ
jgi:hypothetical protein